MINALKQRPPNSKTSTKVRSYLKLAVTFIRKKNYQAISFKSGQV
jgi:hypothetical protein